MRYKLFPSHPDYRQRYRKSSRAKIIIINFTRIYDTGNLRTTYKIQKEIRRHPSGAEVRRRVQTRSQKPSQISTPESLKSVTPTTQHNSGSIASPPCLVSFDVLAVRGQLSLGDPTMQVGNARCCDASITNSAQG